MCTFLSPVALSVAQIIAQSATAIILHNLIILGSLPKLCPLPENLYLDTYIISAEMVEIIIIIIDEIRIYFF